VGEAFFKINSFTSFRRKSKFIEVAFLNAYLPKNSQQLEVAKYTGKYIDLY